MKRKQVRGITDPPKERKVRDPGSFCLNCLRPIDTVAVTLAYREGRRFTCDCGRVFNHG